MNATIKSSFAPAVPYLNLVEGDIVAKRTESATRFDLLRRNVQEGRGQVASVGKFTLIGTEMDAILGRIVVVEVK